MTQRSEGDRAEIELAPAPFFPFDLSENGLLGWVTIDPEPALPGVFVMKPETRQ